jgi:hypothetical protein
MVILNKTPLIYIQPYDLAVVGLATFSYFLIVTPPIEGIIMFNRSH